jgi:hypothetical protein
MLTDVVGNHKRGHLAIVCEAGHQWVWCPHCCGTRKKEKEKEKMLKRLHAYIYTRVWDVCTIDGGEPFGQLGEGCVCVCL